MPNKVCFMFVGAAVLLCSPSAIAQHSDSGRETKPFSASAHLHWGSGINILDDTSPSAFGFGLGLRGGYTLSFGLYIGALFDYYIGTTETLIDTRTEPDTVFDAQFRSAHLAMEVGYDFKILSTLLLRPYIGFGYLDTGASSQLPVLDYNSVAFSPGLSLDFNITESAFVTGNVHLLLPTELLEFSEKSLTIAVGGGVRF